MVKIFRVRGNSMEPTLHHGDFVVAATWRPQPRKDQLAVVAHPVYGTIIKRVISQQPSGYRLTSDNPLGTSSDKLGIIPPKDVLGRVLFTIRAPRPDNMRRE